MNQEAQGNEIDFSVDVDNLYREESITDLKVASIRRLVPVKVDGTEDTSRKTIYIGHTQLMSSQGPLPIQETLEAETLEEALKAFPAAMERSLNEMVEKIQQMQREQDLMQREQSRIIIPGR
ncbi:MAG: cytoplasmic protein [Desulfatibacillum sp.]|nr:cytoplasmic protein [Desulfatibacillum sp.]